MLRFVALSGLVLIGAAPPPVQYPPGVGVLRMMAFVDVTAEAGRRCFPDQNPAFQARIERAEAQFDAYFLKNTPATPEQLAKFKREQASVGDPTFDCRADGDSVPIYKHLQTVDQQQLTSGIDELLARPGKPSFGDCT